MIVPVILAGGSGTRLWPLSQPSTPKQFLKLFGDHTLLQETVRRVQKLATGPILVVTNESLRLETQAQLRELGLTDDQVIILGEPCARNTAPAIALAAAWIRDNQGPDAAQARMLVLPADHHIGDQDAFHQTLHVALEAAQAEVLVTLGIRPTGPETGYGYIHAAALAQGVAHVHRFVEKPDLQTATQYLAAGDYYWNSGMFIWKVQTLLDALQKHMPELGALAGTPWKSFHTSFDQAPNISIDYGILEPADNVRMVPAAFAWSDVGTWESVAQQWFSEGKATAPAVSLDSLNVDVYSHRSVAVIGLDDVMVVDTEEGLLIMKKGHGQQVGTAAKAIAAQTSQDETVRKEVPRVVSKPWGEELIWAETPRYLGKTLRIRKGESLSVQYHREKDETVHVLSGTLCFRHGTDPEALAEKHMKPGESFHIPMHTVHQMIAVTDCEILEVSTPQLDDVVRLLDRYGRAGT